ncbi:hypothetical protein [Wolbachia endosymbiont of Brugia pahangi]|uniref:hypothetical protein n=1 Tax=Wolbachia endosymbiont of Brugia pahangi TaxID=96495 RepID=UPI00143C641B|nr:hypothetical protein [Wolbachia endosymbiont of Brugia pahangi]
MQDKTEFDHSKQTLALAFEIEPGNFNTELGKFKTRKLKQNGNKYIFNPEYK